LSGLPIGDLSGGILEEGNNSSEEHLPPISEQNENMNGINGSITGTGLGPFQFGNFGKCSLKYRAHDNDQSIKIQFRQQQTPWRSPVHCLAQ
jgi:hypothetical protein